MIYFIKARVLKRISFILGICFCFNLFAGEIHETLPSTIDKNASYVFYSHGFIVEGDNPRPVHKRWGVYDFIAVKEALSDSSYHLIATHRPEKTDPFIYSEQLTSQVNKLIEHGVPASNISLVGFSRGGFITAITSSKLANKEVNFVILAACTSGLAKRSEIQIHGHLLSIFETTDTVGSCNDVVARKPELVRSYKELSITTNKEHGAFYRPIDEWLVPVKEWLKRNKH